MAYADQGTSSSKVAALGVVLLFHIGIFGALAIYRPDILKKIVAPIEAVQVKEDKPPPEEPPPPPPKDIEIPPYVPPPEVTIASDAPPPPTISVQAQTPQPAPTYVAPPAPPAPPAAPPAPTGPTQAAQPANAHIFEVSEDDYPPSSLRAEEEGVTSVQVSINAQGRVDTCQVTATSNFPKLDERTCKIAQTRWRFKPALTNGTPVASTLSKRIRWQINRK